MALHIALDPVLYVGRGYAQPDGRARVFGAHGTLDKPTLLNLAAELRALGVHTVLMQRHGAEREINIATPETA